MARKDKNKPRQTPRAGDIQSIVESIRPDEMTTVEEQIEQAPIEQPNRRPSGIAGVDTVTSDAGTETLVYRGTDTPVVPGQPAPSRVAGPQGSTTATAPVTPTGTQPPAQTWTATDGTVFYDERSFREYQDYLSGNRGARQSAFDLLYQEFSQYGLGSLVEPLRGLIQDPSVSASEFTLRLRGTDAYKTRFAANQKRIAKGLTALNEATYLGLEDQYQDIMRRYGLPSSYYAKDELGVQKSFESLIAADVSNVELEDRIQTAYNRVVNAAPEVKASLRDFYPNISDGDILAYALDPENAINEIKRKVTAAEIGAGAMQSGLRTGVQRAEELARFGVTGEQARTGFQAIAGGVERGRQLASIYDQDPYGQETAEQEIFALTGAPEARRRRQRIIKSEEAAFGGQTGLSGGALARDRAGSI
jgi:hypothetical protein